MKQGIATFFSHVMAAIGGNAAGPGDAIFDCIYMSRIWLYLVLYHYV